MGAQTLKTVGEVIEQGVTSVADKGLIPVRVLLGKAEYKRFQAECARRMNGQMEGIVVQLVTSRGTVLIVETQVPSEIRVEYKNAGSLQV